MPLINSRNSFINECGLELTATQCEGYAIALGVPFDGVHDGSGTGESGCIQWYPDEGFEFMTNDEIQPCPSTAHQCDADGQSQAKRRWSCARPALSAASRNVLDVTAAADNDVPSACFKTSSRTIDWGMASKVGPTSSMASEP